MTELWLKYTDENGELRRVLVERDRFVVGRHSENDLSIPSEKISREHLEIERGGDDFIAADCNSSNGTTLNGEDLNKRVTLKNGDSLNLGGGGAKIEVEIISKKFVSSSASSADFGGDFSKSENETPSFAGNSTASKSSSAADIGGIPMSFFYLAPLFGVGILLFLGVIVFVFSGNGKNKTAETGDEIVYSSEPEDEPTVEKETNSKTKETPKPTIEKTSDSNPDSTSEPENLPTTAPKNLPDTVKIEQNSTSFLRRIAQNDPKSFLTSEQAQILNSKIKQFSSSAALADNIKSAKANAAQIQSLATAKNLKPQFLAVAAIAKLGSQRGNVLQTAQSMTEVLDKLSTQVGSERADDSLLVIAAYDQGAAGEFLKMRNMLQQLSNQFPESSRTIRTIWFLHKNGKISEAQYEFALRFLAIGTITQNPKDFNVTAEELKLN
ncbi:MAG: FHA domain-containing protein [Pyrinomonadaceae bacterium]